MAHDIFISYSHKDKSVADAICANLELRGVRCWYAPRDIAPGADWAGSIIDAIRASRVMILVFTDFSNASPQVLREVNNAVSAGVVLVPFRLTASEPTKGMRYYLSTVHWLDAMDAPLESSVKRLCDLADAILSGRAPEPAPLSAPPRKKRRWLPAALAAVIVLLAAGLLYVLGRKAPAPDTAQLPSPEPAAQTADDTPSGETPTQAEPTAEPVLEAMAKPANDGAIISDPANSGTQGNYQCNLQNDGLAASDGEWFYYRSNDALSLYKMRLDGSEKTKLTDEQANQISVLDGKVYYNSGSRSAGVKRMDTDGGNVETLFAGPTEDLRIVDGRLYFRNSQDRLRLYSMELDGTGLRRENDLTELYHLTIWDGCIYWCSAEDGDCIYRADLNGKNITKLTNTAADNLVAADGCLVYNDRSDGYLHVMELATLETARVMPEYVGYMTVTEWGVIGYSGSNSCQLFRAPLNKAAGDVIVEAKVKHVSVVEGYVFYLNTEDAQLYMADVNGENVILL